MACVPEGCSELLSYTLPDGTASPFPLLKVGNVFVLPGVPKLVEAKWEPLRRELERHAGSRTAQYRNRHARPPHAARCSNMHRWLMLRPVAWAVVRVCVSTRQGFDAHGRRRVRPGAVEVAKRVVLGIMNGHVSNAALPSDTLPQKSVICSMTLGLTANTDPRGPG